jgi:amino acid transporter
MSYAKDPEKSIPQAIIMCYTTVLFIALFVLVAAAGAINANILLVSEAPLMLGIELLYGDGSVISDIIAYLIVAGLIVNFFAFTVFSSQQMQAVAESNLLPRALAFRDVHYGAPVTASLCSMVIGLFTTVSFAVLLGDDAAQDTLLMAALLPTMICYMYVLECIVEVRRVEERQKVGGKGSLRQDQTKLGYDPGTVRVPHALLRARLAQIMCSVLICGIVSLAFTSFDYLYGLLVFVSIGLLGYMIMVHKARSEIREEEALGEQEKESLLYTTVPHSSETHGDVDEDDEDYSYVPRPYQTIR